MIATTVALILVGCASTIPQTSSAALPREPTPSGSGSASVGAASAQPTLSIGPGWLTLSALTCGTGGPLFPREAVIGPGDAEMAPDPAAAALRGFLAEPDAPEMPFPDHGWHRVLQTARTVMFIASTGAEPPIVVVSFAASAGGVALDQSGTCNLQPAFPAGIGPASWRVDPAARPTATDTTVTVLATELACAGGKSAEGRILEPIIAETADTVTILLAVRQRPGGQDCQGNPESRATVTLESPLGSRLLYDGSTVPPTKRG